MHYPKPVKALSHTDAVKFHRLQIYAQKYPFRWTDHQTPPPASSLDTSDLRCQTTSGSDPPFFHNALDRPTHVRTDRQTDRSSTGKFDDYRPLRSESDAANTIITARRYASAVSAVIVCLSVRPYVCPFVTNRSTKTAKPRITLTTSYDCPGTLVCRRQKIGEIPTTSHPTGAPNRGGVGSHRCSSTNISLYLRNGAR